MSFSSREDSTEGQQNLFCLSIKRQSSMLVPRQQSNSGKALFSIISFIFVVLPTVSLTLSYLSSIPLLKT